MRTLVRRIVDIATAIALTVLAATASLAQQPEIHQSKRPDYPANALAVGGYDTVAYHTQKRPLPGNPQFRVSWKGAEWQFASQANLDLFLKEPTKYAPQYGGYCAFAVAGGSTAPGDPKVWDVVDGKLYLNLSTGTQSSWRRDPADFIRRGDANWPKVIGR
ncbi:MAG: YHS domain-containing (seleno)protein [Hyphomicrobiaceae bacterium]